MTASRRLSEKSVRKSVIATALSMSRSGLSPGRSGNVSARFEDGMLITPSGMAYETLETSDIVFVGPSGQVRPKERKPSSEWHFHRAAYAARFDRNAIVHTHSMHATVLACAGKAIPAFHYMVAVAGGKDIPCVPYATFGTEAVAEHVASGLKERDACLMAHHGQIVIAATLEGALELAQEVESLAEQYYKLLLLGPVTLISDAEMARMLEKFKSYGQRAQER